MKTTKIITLTLVVAGFLATSCKKEEQPTPDPTESNVQSIIMNTNNSAWKLDGNTYKARLLASEIDQSVLTFGAVNVSIGDGTGYSWRGLPLISSGYEFSYRVYLNFVEIEALSLGNDSGTNSPESQQFKLTIFKADGKKARPNKTDYINCKQGKRTYSLSD